MRRSRCGTCTDDDSAAPHSAFRAQPATNIRIIVKKPSKDDLGDFVIFKAVRDGRPYPDHGLTLRDWATVPPRSVRLDQLVTTKRVLELDKLLADDSTFFGDLFPHVVAWHGTLYLEDGLHRALRAALQQRTSINVRVYSMPTTASHPVGAAGPGTAG